MEKHQIGNNDNFWEENRVVGERRSTENLFYF